MKPSLKYLAVAGLALLLAAPAALAQNMPITPEVSVLPVTEPLDVGGTVLQPGTYTIRVIPSATGRNKIQVMSRDQQKVFATVLAVPHELEPGEKIPATTYVYFPADAEHPRALRTWFASNPPGNHGHDIVYSEGRAKQLAVSANTRVVSYPTETLPTEIETSTLNVVTPQSTIETYTYTPPAPLVTETRTEVETTAPMTSASETRISDTSSMNMPDTASNVPLLALLGLASILGAAAIRFARS